jgi:(E)-4-hydroxy-3-methylbut-2-enyl-diphosphate synthase
MLKIRRKTKTVKVGNVSLGSEHPIVIQSMTNTVTADVKNTVLQIKELVDSGSELVRITINNEQAMKAVPDIINKLTASGYDVPIVGDFHFNGHTLLAKYPRSAGLLSKYRINPGNVGGGATHDKNYEAIIKLAIKHDKPVRIGVNWGSIDKSIFVALMEKNNSLKVPKLFKEIMYEAMIKSALESAQFAEKLGLTKEKIVLSAKMSDVQDLIRVNELLAQKCDYVLHIGLTEAGSAEKGITASSAALAILLQQGIGDTIRVSLTPEPNVPRSKEVLVCQHILQSMNFRAFRPSVTSCPGCGRTNSDEFIILAKEVETYINQRLKEWIEKYPGVEKIHIAVMGCVVNGPGESKYADIGICSPGQGESPVYPVYIAGELFKKLKGNNIKNEFLDILEEYLKNRFR